MDVRSRVSRFSAGAVLAILMVFRAGAAPPDPKHWPAEFANEFFHLDIKVAADGTSIAVQEVCDKILSEQAALPTDASFQYEPAYEQLEIIEAYTRERDGTKIPVTSTLIQTESGNVSSGRFSEAKTVQIQFPQVEVGGAVCSRTRKTEIKTRFPGQFAFEKSLEDRRQWQDFRVSISVPDSLPLQAESQGGDLTEFDTPGQHHWSWAYASPNSWIEPAEPTDVLGFLYLPHILFSSMDNYSQLASIYRGTIASKMQPTAASQRLADELTVGISDPKAQARVLYNWVRSNVRYVQLYLGDGGLIPHDVDTILNTRFGDCKDHAVVLGALLAAKHIASTPVLIGADREYVLPATVQPFVFNHLITYLPDMDLYLDSTVRDARFDVLPSEDAGRSVVHVNDGAVRITPATTAARDRVGTLTTLHVAADGSASGITRLVASGSDSINLRAKFENMNAAQRGEFVRDLLFARDLIGEGSFQIDTAVPADEYAVTVTFRVDNLLNSEDDGAMFLAPLLSGPRRLTDVADAGQRLTVKRFPYGCSPSTVDDRYEIKLPSALQISLPRAVNVEAKDLSYHSEYRRDGDTITVERKFVATPENRICTPADYQTFRTISGIVLRDLHKQIAYRQPPMRPKAFALPRKPVAAKG